MMCTEFLSTHALLQPTLTPVSLPIFLPLAIDHTVLSFRFLSEYLNSVYLQEPQ